MLDRGTSIPSGVFESEQSRGLWTSFGPVGVSALVTGISFSDLDLSEGYLKGTVTVSEDLDYSSVGGHSKVVRYVVLLTDLTDTSLATPSATTDGVTVPSPNPYPSGSATQVDLNTISSGPYTFDCAIALGVAKKARVRIFTYDVTNAAYLGSAAYYAVTDLSIGFSDPYQASFQDFDLEPQKLSGKLIFPHVANGATYGLSGYKLEIVPTKDDFSFSSRSITMGSLSQISNSADYRIDLGTHAVTTADSPSVGLSTIKLVNILLPTRPAYLSSGVLAEKLNEVVRRFEYLVITPVLANMGATNYVDSQSHATTKFVTFTKFSDLQLLSYRNLAFADVDML